MLPEPLAVFIAMPTMGTVTTPTVRALYETLDACSEYGFKVEVALASGSLVHHARTLLANRFLAGDMNRLFWIDSDIDWTPLDFFRIIAHTKKHDCVLGVYPRRNDEGGYFIKFRPDDPPVDADGLVPIEATGMGFSCVTRKVMEELAATKPERIVAGKKQKAIFRMDDTGEEDRGEDYAFWADVQGLGYTVYADCTVNLGHVGQKIYQNRRRTNDTTSKPAIQ